MGTNRISNLQLVNLLGLLGVCCASSARAQNATSAPAVTAFVDVAVIPMDRERVLVHQTVIVRGEKIVALGPAKTVKVPAGAARVDGRGKYLIPGLADMHTHIDDRTGLFLALANGVTTIRDMSFGSVLDGLRQRRAQGELMPPRLYGIGRMADCRDKPSLVQCFTEMKAASYDMLKLYGDGTWNTDTLNTIVAAARQAHLPVGGHVLPGPGLERAFGVPYHSIEHLWGYVEDLLHLPEDFNVPANAAAFDTMRWLRPEYQLDPARVRAIAERTRRLGIWNAPTLAIKEPEPPDTSGGLMGKRYARMGQKRFELDLKILKALQDAGAGILLSTDYMGAPNLSGFAIPHELGLLMRAGLTPYQALATGTRNAARYLGRLDSAGTIAVGKWADLVLLDGNPLKDVHYVAGPAGVMAAGRWFSRADLDARLDSLAAGGCDLHEMRAAAARHEEMTFYMLDRMARTVRVYDGRCMAAESKP